MSSISHDAYMRIARLKLSARQISEHFNISKITLLRWSHDGKFPAADYGKKSPRWYVSTVMQWVNSNPKLIAWLDARKELAQRGVWSRPAPKQIGETTGTGGHK